MMLSILDTRKLNADAQEKLLLSELNTTFRELAAIRQEQAINDATMYSPTSEATLSLYGCLTSVHPKPERIVGE